MVVGRRVTPGNRPLIGWISETDVSLQIQLHILIAVACIAGWHLWMLRCTNFIVEVLHLGRVFRGGDNRSDWCGLGLLLLLGKVCNLSSLAGHPGCMIARQHVRGTADTLRKSSGKWCVPLRWPCQASNASGIQGATHVIMPVSLREWSPQGSKIRGLGWHFRASGLEGSYLGQWRAL